MKQVDAYLKTAFRYAQGDPKEIEDSKLEMKNHLMESINELQQAGLTEKEAFIIAINRFGGVETMSSVARYLFRVQYIFAKRILLIAVVTAILASLLALLLWRVDTLQKNDNFLLAESINSIIASQNISSDETKALLQEKLENYPNILNATIFPVIDHSYETYNNGTTEASYINFEAPQYYYDSHNLASNWRSVDHGYQFSSSSWLISFDVARWFAYIPIVLSIGYAIFAALFTIWASINANQHQRLKLYWIVLFAVTNVLGYCIYLLVDHIHIRNYRSNPAL